MSRRSSVEVGGRPGGRWGWVQCRAMRRRCQRSSVSGVTSQPTRRGRGSAAAIAPSRLLSLSLRVGRLIWRRSTASWWRNTMISRSFERPSARPARASAARNRYRTRVHEAPASAASPQVNTHDRVSGTHTASEQDHVRCELEEVGPSVEQIKRPAFTAPPEPSIGLDATDPSRLGLYLRQVERLLLQRLHAADHLTRPLL